MLLNSSEENSVTSLKFSRKRNTTDQQNDTAIPVKYSRLRENEGTEREAHFLLLLIIILIS